MKLIRKNTKEWQRIVNKFENGEMYTLYNVDTDEHSLYLQNGTYWLVSKDYMPNWYELLYNKEIYRQRVVEEIQTL